MTPRRRSALRAPVSALGYVFHDEWANREPATPSGASSRLPPRPRICWQNPTMNGCAWRRSSAPKARNWRNCATAIGEGIPRRPVAEEAADAGKLYHVLAAIGGEKLVGSAPEMAPGTFWPESREMTCTGQRRSHARGRGRTSSRSSSAAALMPVMTVAALAARALPAVELCRKCLAEPRLSAAGPGLAGDGQGGGERRASSIISA